MQRKNLLITSLAITLSLAAPAANAWPLGRLLHLHPSQASAKNGPISFQLYNKSGIIQDVEIAGEKYTLMPNSGLTVSAPVGTQVIAQTVGLGHNKGDVLFAVQSSLRYDTVSIR
ncbi:MAG TPA: hypothetical protein VHU44_16305 [Acidobacteriaceae bacterium]|jgi:hypothetical protein|nr:hypothetical protein [Acidobacteriaceae bacterium]